MKTAKIKISGVLTIEIPEWCETKEQVDFWLNESSMCLDYLFDRIYTPEGADEKPCACPFIDCETLKLGNERNDNENTQN